LRSVQVEVSWEYTGHRDKNEETYQKKKVIRATSAQQNGNQTVNTDVSNRIKSQADAQQWKHCTTGIEVRYRNKQRRTYWKRDLRDRGNDRPRNPQRQCKTDWAYKVPVVISQRISIYKFELKKSNRAVENPLENPRTVKTKISSRTTGNSDEERNTYRKNKKKTYQMEHQKSDYGRPPEGQNPDRKSWAFKPDGGGIRTTKKMLVIIATGRETYLELPRSGNRDV
jgi:hypothetical protein